MWKVAVQEGQNHLSLHISSKFTSCAWKWPVGKAGESLNILHLSWIWYSSFFLEYEYRLLEPSKRFNKTWFYYFLSLGRSVPATKTPTMRLIKLHQNEIRLSHSPAILSSIMLKASTPSPTTDLTEYSNSLRSVLTPVHDCHWSSYTRRRLLELRGESCGIGSGSICLFYLNT